MLDADTVHRRARRVLPSSIDTCGVLLQDARPPALASLLLPLRRKSSGALAFQLSHDTVRALRQSPQACLDAALTARSGLTRQGPPARYRRWRRAVLDALEVWFTTRLDGKATLLLVPAEALAVYLWRD
ncbi:hypothetical protein CSC70_06970 [Pseudoxanthomonas kalamensis DSM 18571]|uniref:hypothetical protein n=1 Tax=Pseudoxanthomonas kalamensis TaxID=289483 RepID=UPI001390AB79|nr:hypothetical protein [Pseudoxanthomonas kalamensis]KAF1710417.1 hypothetical protein CSC70_06970 [Pseudoxanthomonas kalamensis DSM 18571]